MPTNSGHSGPGAGGGCTETFLSQTHVRFQVPRSGSVPITAPDCFQRRSPNGSLAEAAVLSPLDWSLFPLSASAQSFPNSCSSRGRRAVIGLWRLHIRQ